MAEDGGGFSHGHTGADHERDDGVHHRPAQINTAHRATMGSLPLSPRADTPNPFSRKNTSLDLDDYFVR